MSTETLVQLSGVGYSVQDATLLQDISWEVTSGQRWAILGPNGSGKSTLLRIAAGYLRPNAGGSVRWRGETRVDLRELRRGIGWVTQSLLQNIPAHESVLDTIVSGRFAQVGLVVFPGFGPGKRDYEEAQQQLEILGMQRLVNAQFGYLSQGEKQLVLIARACLARPWWVILDEPCAGLDPGSRERFLTALRGLLAAHPDLSVVFVTHHPEEILPEFHSLLVLREGKVQGNGPRNEVLTPAMLASLYDVTVLEMPERDGRYWPIFGQSHAPAAERPLR